MNHKEGAYEKQATAQQRHLARRALVVDAEIALRHGAGVVSERDHHRPRHQIDPAKFAGNMNGLHLRRKRVDQAGDAAHSNQRSDDQDQAERHQDGSLKKICNYHRPQSAQHAVENDEGARAKDRPGHGKSAGRGDEHAETIESAGAGEELET